MYQHSVTKNYQHKPNRAQLKTQYKSCEIWPTVKVTGYNHPHSIIVNKQMHFGVYLDPRNVSGGCQCRLISVNEI